MNMQTAAIVIGDVIAMNATLKSRATVIVFAYVIHWISARVEVKSTLRRMNERT